MPLPLIAGGGLAATALLVAGHAHFEPIQGEEGQELEEDRRALGGHAGGPPPPSYGPGELASGRPGE